MESGGMFRVILRRWRVSVPALFLTVIAATVTYVKWPTTYQSSAELTLVASKTLSSSPGNGSNPYLAIGGLAPLASILITELSSNQAIQQLAALGVTDSFTAASPPFNAGPFVSLSLSGKNPTRILNSMPTIVNFAEKQLYSLQQTPISHVAVPTNGQIKAVVISSPSTPAPVTKKKRELVAGVAIAGLVISFILSFVAEAMARRRGKDTGIKVEDFSSDAEPDLAHQTISDRSLEPVVQHPFFSNEISRD